MWPCLPCSKASLCGRLLAITAARFLLLRGIPAPRSSAARWGGPAARITSLCCSSSAEHGEGTQYKILLSMQHTLHMCRLQRLGNGVSSVLGISQYPEVGHCNWNETGPHHNDGPLYIQRIRPSDIKNTRICYSWSGFRCTPNPDLKSFHIVHVLILSADLVCVFSFRVQPQNTLAKVRYHMQIRTAVHHHIQPATSLSVDYF